METQVLKQATIQMNPEIIRMLGKKLYQNSTAVILTRELLQNARDAVLKNNGSVKFEINSAGNMIHIVCDDNGCGMDDDTLLNTFLTIGASKKDEGAVGGFGVAKVALFAAEIWSCHTLNNQIDYTLSYRQGKTRKGTSIIANVKRQNWNDYNLARLMLQSSNCPRLMLDGERVKPYKGRKMIGRCYWTDDQYCTIYTAPALHGTTDKIFYRINGLTQYAEDLWDNYNFNFIVDFDGISYRPTDDSYPFTMSREQVKDSIRNTVMLMLKPMLKNKLTAAAKNFAGNKRERIRKNSRYIIVDQPKQSNDDQLFCRHIMACWKAIVDLIDPGCKSGMTFNKGTRAERRVNDGSVYYLINPRYIAESYTDKGDDPATLIWLLWHLGVHEATHKHNSDHDELFTSHEYEVASASVQKIVEGMSSLRPYGRKALAAIAELQKTTVFE